MIQASLVWLGVLSHCRLISPFGLGTTYMASGGSPLTIFIVSRLTVMTL